MLPGYQDNLTKIQNCVDHNYEIIKLIIKDAEYMFENKPHDVDGVSIITCICSGEDSGFQAKSDRIMG